MAQKGIFSSLKSIWCGACSISHTIDDINSASGCCLTQILEHCFFYLSSNHLSHSHSFCLSPSISCYFSLTICHCLYCLLSLSFSLFLFSSLSLLFLFLTNSHSSSLSRRLYLFICSVPCSSLLATCHMIML